MFTADFHDLAKKLKHEKLFIYNERREIELLNRKVHSLSTSLLHSTWLAGLQRLTPNLAITDLVDAHKFFGPKLQTYTELVSLLRSSLEFLGLCVATWERERGPMVDKDEALQGILHLLGGIGGPLPEDEVKVLELLGKVAVWQLPSSPAPRRSVRQGAFAAIYRLVTETSPSCRLFLLAALHSPIVHVLSSEEPTENLNQDVAGLDRTEKVARLTGAFVEAILSSVSCFPPGLARLIKSIHMSLSPHQPEKEVHILCTDLVWALFICPAVANPELFGLAEAELSAEARRVLSQVSTLLQALALHRWEGTDPRLQEYVSYFDTDSLSSVLDTILSSEPSTPTCALTRRSVFLPVSNLQPLCTWLKASLTFVELSGVATAWANEWSQWVRVLSAVDEREPRPGKAVVFQVAEPVEWVGLAPEQEFKKEDEDEDEEDGREKRTRFSQDDGSIGTSDNLEAVSEAASTHSASSSIDADRDSDLLSANVSGRGTPNVSGRNTPTEEPPPDSDSGSDVLMRTPAALQPPSTKQKQARSEIEDKFCKFEIKVFPGGDETVSLISDTWSTEVLASDSEFGDRLLLPERGQQRPDATVETNNPDTLSEAWSTDVGGTNDSERLHDFDVEESQRGEAVFDTPRSSAYDKRPSFSDKRKPYSLMSVTTLSVSGSSSANFRPSTVDLLLFDEPAPMEVEKEPQATPGTSRSALKTITFDKTAERGDRDPFDDSTRTKRFFRNFRLPFKSSPRRSKPQEDLKLRDDGEDILAKYRRKPVETTDGPLASAARELKLTPQIRVERRRSELVWEARRKIRAVLGTCELAGGVGGTPEEGSDTCLIHILQLEVAGAIAREDRILAAQIQEAIRTVKILGQEGTRRLHRLLLSDYRRRTDYTAYLIRAKQGLLATIQFLERATAQAKHNHELYLKCLTRERVSLMLDEARVGGFIEEFGAVDGKVECLGAFLEGILRDLVRSGGDFPSQALLEDAVEQNIVARIYLQALHPNGEIDLHRDAKLTAHINQLSTLITPSHKDLRISRSHLGEFPWPAAQAELRLLVSHRSARDKLQCVLRCCQLIVSLIGLSDKAVAADDFVPVLVFVVIKANPPSLLSTVQYVNSFAQSRITGEDQYWWTQFCSTVEFIKTMDYSE